MSTRVTKQAPPILFSPPWPSEHLCISKQPLFFGLEPWLCWRSLGKPLQLGNTALRIRRIRYFKTLAWRDCIQAQAKVTGRGRRRNIYFPLSSFNQKSSPLLPPPPAPSALGGKKQRNTVRGREERTVQRVLRTRFHSTPNRGGAF